MNIRNTIVKHYKKFFDLHAKGIALTEDDHLDIDWAESLVKDCFIPDVNNWVACNERLPEHLQTVWLANKEKQWVCLGCLVDSNDGWHWAESNGVIYVDEGKIVSECESDDLDVTHWCALPEPPCC